MFDASIFRQHDEGQYFSEAGCNHEPDMAMRTAVVRGKSYTSKDIEQPVWLVSKSENNYAGAQASETRDRKRKVS